MYLRLTDLDNNLLLVNIDKIDAVGITTLKGNKCVTKICIVGGYFWYVKETVSEISLLLQEANKVI